MKLFMTIIFICGLSGSTVYLSSDRTNMFGFVQEKQHIVIIIIVDAEV